MISSREFSLPVQYQTCLPHKGRNLFAAKGYPYQLHEELSQSTGLQTRQLVREGAT